MFISFIISYSSYSECPGSLIRLIRVASEDSKSFRSFCGSSGAICRARSASLGAARGGAASGASGIGPSGAGASVAGGAGGEILFGV